MHGAMIIALKRNVTFIFTATVYAQQKLKIHIKQLIRKFQEKLRQISAGVVEQTLKQLRLLKHASHYQDSAETRGAGTSKATSG